MTSEWTELSDLQEQAGKVEKSGSSTQTTGRSSR
jgi:hypothetical protein